MKFQILLFLFFISFKPLPVVSYQTEKTASENIIRITFGSCNKFYKNEDSSIFKTIKDYNPHVFFWIGDASYIDNMPIPPIWFPEMNETKIEEKFNYTKNDPDYVAFAQNTTILGIWDDHDYNQNNGDKNFEHKEIIRKHYLNFIGETKYSPRWTRPGIYEAYHLGRNSEVLVILLDVRFNKDQKTEEMLGEEQWKWLNPLIELSKAKLTFIVSGTQILPDDRPIVESWFDKSREKLMEMIKKHKRSGVFFLSGDVHWAEMMSHPCSKNEIGYTIHELTSSGLSHSVSRDLIFVPYLHDALLTDVFSKPNERFFENNFGLIDIDTNNLSVTLNAIGRDGEVKLQKKIEYAEVKFDSSKNNNQECPYNESKFKRFLSNLMKKTSEGRILWIIFLITVFLIVRFLKKLVFLLLSILFSPLKKHQKKKEKRE